MMNKHVRTVSVQGFSLVELMITLVIASLLLAVVAPGMATLINNNRLQTSAENLFTSMMLARSEALKRNQEVIICKSSDGAACAGSGTDWESGWLVFSDADGDNVPDPNEILRVAGALSGGVTLRVSVDDLEDRMSYNTDGTASAAGTFILCNDQADTSTAREIGVALTGRPRINKTTTDCTPTL